jgi:pyruvate,orthophosphate dikinase
MGASPATEVIDELYGLGYRHFSVPTERIEALRLRLGHAAGSAGSASKAK